MALTRSICYGPLWCYWRHLTKLFRRFWPKADGANDLQLKERLPCICSSDRFACNAVYAILWKRILLDETSWSDSCQTNTAHQYCPFRKIDNAPGMKGLPYMYPCIALNRAQEPFATWSRCNVCWPANRSSAGDAPASTKYASPSQVLRKERKRSTWEIKREPLH